MSPRGFVARFTRPVFIWSLLALVLELLSQWLARNGFAQSKWLTLLPLVPMMFFVIALVRTILRMDELQQRICLESISIAFVLTLVLTLVFIGLERAEIYRAKWNELGTYMLFLWACAYVFSAWRYR